MAELNAQGDWNLTDDDVAQIEAASGWSDSEHFTPYQVVMQYINSSRDVVRLVNLELLIHAQIRRIAAEDAQNG